MRQFRPSQWPQWSIVGAGLPLLAAGTISTGSLQTDVLSRANSSLTANESLAWAKIELAGRDATLSGTSTSQEALDAAVAAVAGTYGVRRVTNRAIVEPVKPLAEAGVDVGVDVGVDAGRLSVASYGESGPVDSAQGLGQVEFEIGEVQWIYSQTVSGQLSSTIGFGWFLPS